MRRALITGVGGQDGHYLAELLRRKGYAVLGCGRPGSLVGSRADELVALGVELVELDLRDPTKTARAVAGLRPDEIYNFAGDSFVPRSWEDPGAAIVDTSLPVVHLLEAIRTVHPDTRFYQSSTSEIFGRTATAPQTERTPLAPANPYGAAKAMAHHLVAAYRDQYGVFACAGILYNHESRRRPARFVTAKVAAAARAIRLGAQRELVLGDLDVARDWGYAGEYVEAMWRMLQLDAPEDFIIGTGTPHTVRELCQVAFAAVGLDDREYVRTDPSLRRNGPSAFLVADASKAERLLGWRPRVTFEALIRAMVFGTEPEPAEAPDASAEAVAASSGA